MEQTFWNRAQANLGLRWLFEHLDEGCGVSDENGVVVAGVATDRSRAPIIVAGHEVGHAHGPDAVALASLLCSLVGSSDEKDGSEEEFREIILALASELQLTPLLRKIMDAAARLLEADRGTLFLNDEQTGELWSPIALGMHGREIRFANHLGIAGSVFTTKTSINIEDAYGDARFNRDTDRETGYVTRTILCCPVVNKQGQAIGAIQALNKADSPFTDKDAERLTAFAAQASMAIENAQLYHNLEEKVRERTRDLNQTLEQLSSELDRAAEYVRRLIPEPYQGSGLEAQGRFVPSAALGGDAFGYHWLDPDHFVIYLTDVSGHGVGAALLSVSISNVLRAHTLPDVDFRKPSQVLAGLNQAFPMAEHNFMFFTIWYGVYNRLTQTLDYASGGHPPALLLGGEARRLSTKNLLMGGMQGLEFKVASCPISSGDRLIVFSDGCYEVEMTNGSMWTLDEFMDYLEGGEADMDELLDHVRALGGSDELEDDFSIFEIKFE